MCTINVSDIIKDRSYPEAGKILYERIVELMDNCDNITLVMEGVTALPSMFLNTSIGRLINENGKDFVTQLISFSQINKTQAERVVNYIKSI